MKCYCADQIKSITWAKTTPNNDRMIEIQYLARKNNIFELRFTFILFLNVFPWRNTKIITKSHFSKKYNVYQQILHSTTTVIHSSSLGCLGIVTVYFKNCKVMFKSFLLLFNWYVNFRSVFWLIFVFGINMYVYIDV